MRKTLPVAIAASLLVGILWIAEYAAERTFREIILHTDLFAGTSFAIAAVTFTVIPSILIAALFVRLHGGNPLCYPRFRRVTRDDIDTTMTLFSVTLVLYCVHLLIVSYTPVDIAEANVYTATTFAVVATNILSLAIITVIAEEYVFRGILQEYLHQHTTPLIAVAGASVGFGLLHIPLTAVFAPEHILRGVFTTALGFVWGWAYYSTGNFAAPVALHGAYNGLLVLLYFLVV